MEDPPIACVGPPARQDACPARRGCGRLALSLGAPLLLLCAVRAASAASTPDMHAGTHAASSAANAPLAAYTLSSIAGSDYWLRLDTGLDVSRAALTSRWSSVVQRPDSRPDYSLAGTDAARGWNRLPQSPALLEFAPTHLLASDPQRDYRPQFALASSSATLRSLLRGAGVDASGCLAPLMRMHSTIAGSGPRTNVSLSARCSIH